MIILKSIFPGTMHTMSAFYLQQLSSTLVLRAFSVFISLLYVPLVLGYLDQEKYGIWITLTTIVNWIRLLDVGMGNGLRNKLTETVALKQNEQGKIYVSTTYGALGGIFLIVLILFFFINPYLNWQGILNSKLISPDELVTLTNIVVVFIVLSFILQPISLIYAAHGNSAAGGIMQLIISSVSLLLIWLVSVFAEKGNILLLAWIVTCVPVLVYIIVSVYTFSYKYKYLKPSFNLIRIKESGKLLRLSAQFFVVQITATVIFSSIPFVVAQLFSAKEVAVFNISNSIFNLPIMLMGLITAPAHPLVTHAFSLKDFTWLRSMLRKQVLVAIILSLGTVILIVISPLIYKIWISDRLTIPFNLSIGIGIYTIINVISAPFSTYINAIGKIRMLVIFGPLSIILFVSLSIGFSKLLENVIAIPIALSLISIPNLFIMLLILKKTFISATA